MTFIGRDESHGIRGIDEIVDVWMVHWVRDRNDIHWFVVFGRKKRRSLEEMKVMK